MRYDLKAMARRAGTRRRLITFAPIFTTQAQTTGLAAVYHRMLAPWYNSRERILELYSRELARVLTADAIDDLADLFEELGREMQRLVLDLTPDLRDWAFRLERWHAGKWGRTVLAGANVDVSYLIGPQDAQEPISAFLARNTALVKDIGTQAQGRISDAVYRGLQQRTPAREVGKEIANATGMARKRANNIAADQSTKIASALDGQRQREAGLTVWKWRHSGKLHPRKWHKDRDGNLYADEKADRGKLKSGQAVLEPPEADDLPGRPPYCGCVRVGMLVLDGELL